MTRRTGSGFLLLALGVLGLRYTFVGSSSGARSSRVAMEAERKFIVGGNWKANGSPESVKKLVEELNEGEVTSKDVEVVCAPPFVFLSEVQGTLRKDYAVAAQNLWDKDPGAWTGETPAQMLADMGIKWVVLGHSERRENCGETSQIVAEKTKFAVDKGLSTLTCIGEKLDARESGKTFDVLDEQLKPLADVLSEEDWEKVVLAYEPVWAIGTGKVATPEQALISLGGRSLVAHSVAALRRLGVEDFYICRGWKGDVFEDHLDELGPGVQLIDCLDFASTGMLESLRLALRHVEVGRALYVCYGDIIFRPCVARQLLEAHGDIRVVVNAAAPGRQSKGFAEVEVVSTSGVGKARLVRRIGKNRHVHEADMAGEFAGLMKFTAAGRQILDETLKRLFQEDTSCTGQSTTFTLPWWLEPVQRASLCDLLQYMADEGVSIHVAMGFGGWHEVNTPQDLQRAWNDTALFLSAEDTREQVKAMGSCLLSEANDLKRPLPIVAKELNVSLELLECLLQGNLEVSDAFDVIRKMSEVYAVPLNDLWLDADDTNCGVRCFSLEAAESSSRVLDRQDKSGHRTPYYEYRDSAMSRCSQFRPEWIKVLRVVTSGDPLDPDIQMNNGHLMMQTTLFIGPVDFYWTDRHGHVHRREMNTGDSNYISPFVPHSFTARAESPEAIIIAVTYGGAVRRAFREVSRVGATNVGKLAGDWRDPVEARKCLLKRRLDAECRTFQDLVDQLKMPPGRVEELVAGQEATALELQALAEVLHVRLSDLMVCPLKDEEEVVVTSAAGSRSKARKSRSYVLAPLARTRHQPDLKTFELEVLDAAQPGEGLSCGLHSFVYHFGSVPVELTWGKDSAQLLRPGDSAYVAPMVEHRFSVVPDAQALAVRRPNPNGSAHGLGRRLLVVRIPGQLSGETLAEYATFSAFGRDRVGAETVRWYN